MVLGILTGMRGLCNGLGPAIFGFLFWVFHVNLGEGMGINKNIVPLTETAAGPNVTAIRVPLIEVSSD